MHLLPVVFSLIISFNPDYETAKSLSRNGQHEESEALFAFINRRRLPTDEYFYFRFMNRFQLNDKNGAEKYALNLDEETADLPVRYLALVKLMKDDLKRWEKNGLGNIARDMNKIRDRLDQTKGGPETRKLQKKVLDDLDAMIKKAEDDKKKSEEQASAKQEQEKKEQDGKDQGSDPLKDSKIADAAGKGMVDPKKMREVAAVWGNLPEKERVKAMKELTKGLPAKYRDAIETYLKSIMAKSGKP